MGRGPRLYSLLRPIVTATYGHGIMPPVRDCVGLKRKMSLHCEIFTIVGPRLLVLQNEPSTHQLSGKTAGQIPFRNESLLHTMCMETREIID